jgi:superfamily II DNA or RNA helicase
MQGDRDATMAYFTSRGGVMVAIRCLDEGVDIPAVSHALILASSRNPREFIQRRGRVLRTAPGKHSAVIYDVLVEPGSDSDRADRLIGPELARAAIFAREATNQATYIELTDLADRLGIDLTDQSQSME